MPFPAGGADAISNGDYVIGPDYAPAPELATIAANATGSLHEIVFLAQDSKIYPGRKRKVGYTPSGPAPGGAGNAVPGDIQWEAAPYEPRHVWVYIPGGYKAGTPLPFMVVQDGHDYADRLHHILDNMIAQKRLPAMAAICIDPGSTPAGSPRAEDAQGSERGYEYDTVSGQYSDFVESEILPRVSKEFGLTLTRDPDGRAVMGASSGAAAAISMAWFHPERYHRVLVYSPTLVNQQSPVNPALPHGAWEYHDHLIAQSEKKPIRIWMEVGEKDLHYDDAEASWHNWPLANNRMAAVLKKKGYDYKYVWASDAHHVDPRVVAQTLPSALEWLWRDYPKN
jgi:enterochelin esterase family protein